MTHSPNLRVHLEEIHNMVGHDTEIVENMAQCDICDKVFKTNHRLKAHRKVHEKNRRVECNICHNFLSSKSKLDRHVKQVH